MDIQFHLKEADFVSAGWMYVKQHWWRFLYRYRHPLEIAGAALAIIVLHPESRRDAAWVLLVGLALIGCVLLRYRWVWHRQFQRFGERTVSATVNLESISLRGGKQETVRRSGEFTYICESDRIFLFSTVKGGILFLPKAPLSEAQIGELRCLISAHATGKVKLVTGVASPTA
jgi:hypothetical protein